MGWHKKAGNCRICKWRTNSKVQEGLVFLMASRLIFWPRQCHSKPQNGLNSHSLSWHITSAPKNKPSWNLNQNYFLCWLWWPLTKCGHHTFCPCLAFAAKMITRNRRGDSNRMSLLNVVGRNETTIIIILSWSKLRNSLDACIVIDIAHR